MCSIRPILTIARRELMEAIRSRWVLLTGALFGVLALALSAFGMQSVGARGFSGFSRTAIGLLNLTLYLTPLLALLLSINSMAAEREEGPLELLLAQPIPRSAIVLGKFCGLAAALTAALLCGLGGAGLLIGIAGADTDIGGYLLLLLRSVGLGLAFLSLGLWIASAAATRLHALAHGLLLWFATVVLYDLVVVGATALIGGSLLKTALGALLVANPVDLVRIGTLIHLGGADSFGLTAQALIGFLRGTPGTLLLSAALLGWIVVPLLGATRTFNRRDFAA
ncbi:MAG: ABC transporter permease [Chloroflexaceae bacterium]|jgi:Cu-processing system permease protein|nr:ABC transporter permease [Chloroflexaceae bacterium]